MLVLLLLVTFSSAQRPGTQFPVSEHLLGCERYYGNNVLVNINFTRPLQPMDKITFNGTVWPQPESIRTDIYITSPVDQLAIHMRQDLPRATWTIFNSWLGNWGPEAFGPSVYSAGQPYQVTMQYTGTSFLIFSGSTLIYTYPLRSPNTYSLGATLTVGGQTLNWIEIECANPPATSAPMTTRRSGNGNGHGGHGHHHHGYSDISSDSSDSCED